MEIIERAGMVDCKPCATPVDTSSNLPGNIDDLVSDPTYYRSLDGVTPRVTEILIKLLKL
jgi:hypothetical protein